MSKRSFVTCVSGCALAILCMAGNGIAGEPETELRWKFTAGRKLVYELKQTHEELVAGGKQKSSNNTVRLTFIGLGNDTAVVCATIPSGGVGLWIPGPRTIPIPYYKLLGVVRNDGTCQGPLPKDINLLTALFPLPPKKVAKLAEWPLKMAFTTPSPVPDEAAKEPRKESAAAKLDELGGEGENCAARIAVSGSAEHVVDAEVLKLGLTGQASFLPGKGRFEEARCSIVCEKTHGKGENAGKDTDKSSVGVRFVQEASIDPDSKELQAWKLVGEGLELSAKDQYEKAAAAFVKALALHEDLEGVRLNLVALYAKGGKFEQAYECLQKEKAIHPKEMDQHFVYTAIIYILAEQKLGGKARDELFGKLDKKYPEIPVDGAKKSEPGK